MGMLAALTGNAAGITPAEGTELFKQVLMEDEPVSHAYQLFRDAFGFTDRDAELKIYATRDPTDALEVADRIAVLRQGRIVQCGTPL